MDSGRGGEGEAPWWYSAQMDYRPFVCLFPFFFFLFLLFAERMSCTQRKESLTKIISFILLLLSFLGTSPLSYFVPAPSPSSSSPLSWSPKQKVVVPHGIATPNAEREYANIWARNRKPFGSQALRKRTDLRDLRDPFRLWTFSGQLREEYLEHLLRRLSSEIRRRWRKGRERKEGKYE